MAAASDICFSDQIQHPLPSVMEQIGVVKLLHIPRAIARGVDIFMLDLDVGFLENPRWSLPLSILYHCSDDAHGGASIQVHDRGVLRNSDSGHLCSARLHLRHEPQRGRMEDMVRAQTIFLKGVLFSRNPLHCLILYCRHTEPLPNIGMFLCRGNNRTAKMFAISWSKYLKMPQVNEHGVDEKSMPGRDQNHVLDAMRYGPYCLGNMCRDLSATFRCQYRKRHLWIEVCVLLQLYGSAVGQAGRILQCIMR